MYMGSQIRLEGSTFEGLDIQDYNLRGDSHLFIEGLEVKYDISKKCWINKKRNLCIGTTNPQKFWAGNNSKKVDAVAIYDNEAAKFKLYSTKLENGEYKADFNKPYLEIVMDTKFENESCRTEICAAKMNSRQFTYIDAFKGSEKIGEYSSNSSSSDPVTKSFDDNEKPDAVPAINGKSISAKGCHSTVGDYSKPAKLKVNSAAQGIK
jgi:hypothetical protein